MNVGLRDLGVPARPDRADGGALGDGRSLDDRDRAEMGERDRVSVGGLIVTLLPEAGTVPANVTVPGLGGDDRRAGRAADVDAPMLAGGIRMRRIEHERLEHRPVGGPGPGCCFRRQNQHGGNRRAKQERFELHSFLAHDTPSIETIGGHRLENVFPIPR